MAGLDELLRLLKSKGGSDLHLAAGMAPLAPGPEVKRERVQAGEQPACGLGMLEGLDEHPLDLPHVAGRQPPVIRLQRPEVGHAIRLHASREVHVGLHVAECQRPRRPEDGPPPVEARIARPGHGTPAVRPTVDKDHVVQQVGGFEAEHKRWVAVLLENGRGGERGFQAVRTSGPDHAPEAPERLAAHLVVIGQTVQPPLHGGRRPQARDECAFPRCQRQRRRFGAVSGREREPL